MLVFYIYLSLVVICSLIIKKKGFFLNFSGEIHQSFSNKGNVPLLGGIFILAPISIIFLDNIILNLVLISIFLIGFFSDCKILVSPKKRFIFQTIIIFFFVVVADLKIASSRIELFDIFLNNQIFSYFFSTFCLLILTNGTNFIDGLNGIVITNTIIILFILNNLNLINGDIISDHTIFPILLLLALILLLNFSNILMLGDSGAYLLGFFLGLIVIKSHISYPHISPYFFISLIWYPCFENLFSIVRKLKKKSSPLKPDSKHFHQLVFFYIKRRYKMSLIFSNNLSSIIICFFNFLIIYSSSLNPISTIYQIQLIFASVVLYSTTYVFLNKFYKLNFQSEK